MVQTDLATFNEAVKLAQSGQKLASYQMLCTLSRTSPNDPNLLMWLAFTTPVPSEARRAASQALILAPNDPTVRQCNEWVSQHYPLSVPPNAPQSPTKPTQGYWSYFVLCAILAGVIGYLAWLITPSYTLLGETYKEFNLVSLSEGLLVVASSLWACLDANQRRNKYGPGAAESPLGVLISCLILWLFLFPLYLAQRKASVTRFGA